MLFLQQVDISTQPECLDSLASMLGGYSVAFFGHVAGRYGNALLSRHSICQTRETHLRGGSELSFPVGMRKRNGEIAKEGEKHRLGRGLLEADVDVPGGMVTFAVTHLDHISESQREVQLEHILQSLAPSLTRPLVLLGDMNALTRNDYTDDEWEMIEQNAESKGWAPPSFGCLSALTSNGLQDAFVQSRGGTLLSSRRDAEADQITTAHVGHPLMRVDYCFASHALGLKSTVSKVEVGMVSSDHFPVTFDFSGAAPDQAGL